MTFTQVLMDQKDRDDRIVRLAGMMTNVFAFVEDAEPLKKIKAHIKTITLLMQQVTECGYFITDYAKRKNFCQSLPLSEQPTLISLQGFGQQSIRFQLSMQRSPATKTSSKN